MNDITEIFAQYAPLYLEKFGDKIPYNHLKTINDILGCRTSDFGGSIYYCDECRSFHYTFHSCKNRHCPKCGSQDSAKWLEKQKRKLLPVNYFMVTFTVPKEFRFIIRANQRLFYSILFKASSAALRILLKDPKYAGGEIGFTSVLHTWTRKLIYHPHIHTIIPAGAFDFQRNVWNSSHHKFLVPVKALSLLFRKYFQQFLKDTNIKIYNQIPESIWRNKEFITNSIAVGKGEAAFKYLSNYVFKTAISNNRIVNCENHKVTFKYKDSETGVTKLESIDVFDFIRRFLQHVLPKRFQKVRYFGFLCSSSKEKWNQVVKYFDIDITDVYKESKTKSIYAINCKNCSSEMKQFATILRRPRSPPRALYKDILRRFSNQI